MKVEVSSDKPITETVLGTVIAAVEAGLARHKDRLSRAEVHLKNVAGEGPSRLLECKIEARPRGLDPVVVGHEAATLEGSVAIAAEKMDRLLESMFGRLDSTR